MDLIRDIYGLFGHFIYSYLFWLRRKKKARKNSYQSKDKNVRIGENQRSTEIN